MKKLFICITAVVVLTVLSGCSKKPADTPIRPTPTAAPTATPIITPEPSAVPEITPSEPPAGTGTDSNLPPVDVLADGSALTTADYLTPIIINSMDITSAPANPKFAKFYILCNMSFREDPGSCYKGAFPYIKYNSQFKIGDANRVIHQLLGDYSFDAMSYADKLPNGQYNPDTDALEFSTEFGWGLLCYHPGDFVRSDFSADSSQVITTFELFVPDSSADDPETVSDGEYRLIYDIITENGETFLRVNRFEKINN